MDCSFDPEAPMPPAIEHRTGGRKFLTSPILVAYARYFDKLVKLLPDAQIDLAGDGLLQAMHGKR
jgi:hypothetical protein